MKTDKYYPFDEGDTYYTVEDGQIVESVWDSVSEEIYDEFGDKYKYFHTYRSAYGFWLMKEYDKNK
jgi:hypothetical protein